MELAAGAYGSAVFAARILQFAFLANAGYLQIEVTPVLNDCFRSSEISLSRSKSRRWRKETPSCHASPLGFRQKSDLKNSDYQNDIP